VPVLFVGGCFTRGCFENEPAGICLCGSGSWVRLRTFEPSASRLRPLWPGQQRVAMTLWTFCQSVLLTFNAFAILNEQRFLDKYGLGQGAVNAGYVPSGSARGQLIGVITATQYGRVPLVVLNVLVIFVKMVFG